MMMAIILFMGAVSGAHLKPVVSIAFALAGAAFPTIAGHRELDGDTAWDPSPRKVAPQAFGGLWSLWNPTGTAPRSVSRYRAYWRGRSVVTRQSFASLGKRLEIPASVTWPVDASTTCVITLPVSSPSPGGGPMLPKANRPCSAIR